MITTFPPGSLQQAYVSDEYSNLCPTLLPTDSDELMFTRTQCCQGSCVMWSAWVSKSTHAHASGQPAAHSAGGWFLTGSWLQPPTWYYSACTTLTAAPVTTTLWWEKNAERISTVTERPLTVWASLFVLHSVVLMLRLCNATSLLFLTIRESSRRHVHRLWRRKLVNSASWHVTVGDTLPSLRHRLHHLPLGYWEPQVRFPAHPPMFHMSPFKCVCFCLCSRPTVGSYS